MTCIAEIFAMTVTTVPFKITSVGAMNDSPVCFVREKCGVALATEVGGVTWITAIWRIKEMSPVLVISLSDL